MSSVNKIGYFIRLQKLVILQTFTRPTPEWRWRVWLGTTCSTPGCSAQIIYNQDSWVKNEKQLKKLTLREATMRWFLHTWRNKAISKHMWNVIFLGWYNDDCMKPMILRTQVRKHIHRRIILNYLQDGSMSYASKCMILSVRSELEFLTSQSTLDNVFSYFFEISPQKHTI